MNCEDVRKFSFAYLDEEFDDRDKVEFEAHLAMCGDCRGSIELDARFRDTVRKHLVSAPCTPEVRARVQERLAAARRSARLSQTLAVPMALAASFLLAFGSYQMLSNSEQQGPETGLAAATAPSPNGGRLAVVAPAQVHGAEGVSVPTQAPAPQAGAAAAQNRRAAGVALAASMPRRTVASTRSVRGVVGAGGVRLASAEHPVPSAGGGAALSRGANVSITEWPVPSARSAAALRSMVRAHAQPLPDEISGFAADVQRYLSGRMAGIGAPPLDEGTGVHLRGARFSQVGGQPAVVYRYQAFGKSLTAIRFLSSTGAPFDEPGTGDATPGQPGAASSGSIGDTLAGFSILHVLRNGERFALVGELDPGAMKALLEPAG